MGRILKQVVKRGEIMIELSMVCDVFCEDIDKSDAPDYCDAYISEASILEDGVVRLMTQEELDELNDDSDFVHESVINQGH